MKERETGMRDEIPIFCMPTQRCDCFIFKKNSVSTTSMVFKAYINIIFIFDKSARLWILL